jgi:hypothetical protein
MMNPSVFRNNDGSNAQSGTSLFQLLSLCSGVRNGSESSLRQAAPVSAVSR